MITNKDNLEPGWNKIPLAFLWYLLVYVNEDGSISKFGLYEKETANYYFDNEKEVRKVLAEPGEENSTLVELFGSYVEKYGMNQLFSAIKPFITEEIHHEIKGALFNMTNEPVKNMSCEEKKKYIDEKFKKATTPGPGYIEYMRKLIIGTLEREKIDPNTVDIDETIAQSKLVYKTENTKKEPRFEDMIDLDCRSYNGDPTYFIWKNHNDKNLSNGKYVKFMNVDGQKRGYILFDKDGIKYWKYFSSLVTDYEWGEINGYVIKQGMFNDIYEELPE